MDSNQGGFKNEKAYYRPSSFSINYTGFSRTPINTQTKTWKRIPITVDAKQHTYSTSKGYLMPEGNYYYSYSGFRCLEGKTKIGRVKPVVLKSQDTQGKVIYCYPDK